MHMEEQKPVAAAQGSTERDTTQGAPLGADSASLSATSAKSESFRRLERGVTVVGGLGLFAAILGALLSLDQLLLRHTPLAIQVAFTSLVAGFGIISAIVLYSRATGHRIRHAPTGPNADIEQFGAGVGYPFIAFVVVTALLLRHDVLVKGAGVSSSGANLVWGTAETYGWALVDAVPVLDLTAVFDWHPAIELTNLWGRVFVLAFKIALIIPLFQLAGRAIQRWVWRTASAEG